jgi:hypothetical protein
VIVDVEPGVGETAKLFCWEDVCGSPVKTTTVCEIGGAFEPITKSATAVVGLVTVTGPRVPGAAPPTEMPAPKVAVVEPWTKFVPMPEMVTDRACPGCPVIGLTATMLVDGVMVKVAPLLLESPTPARVVPAIETLYAVGLATFTDAGIWKVTRLTLPVIVVRAEAGTVTATPLEVAGVNVTRMLEGEMASVGKPEPVRLIVVTGCALVGEVVELRVTATDARAATAGSIEKRRNERAILNVSAMPPRR